MTRRASAVVLALAVAAGCASDWQTTRVITPITYALPEYRHLPNVGNLRRLAVLPVRVRGVGLWGLIAYSHWTDSGDVYEGLCTYLETFKGYEVVRVVDESGRWRPELVVGGEGDSIERLREAWEAADDREAREAAVRRLGRALAVDGVVSAFTARPGLEGPWATAETAAVVMVMVWTPAPLIWGYSTPSDEVAIYETTSGALVWRSYVRGRSVTERDARFANSPLFACCADLDNAIPAVVVGPPSADAPR